MQPEFGPYGGGNSRVRRQRHRNPAALLPSRSCDEVRTQSQRNRRLDRANRCPVFDPPPVRHLVVFPAINYQLSTINLQSHLHRRLRPPRRSRSGLSTINYQPTTNSPPRRPRTSCRRTSRLLVSQPRQHRPSALLASRRHLRGLPPVRSTVRSPRGVEEI